MKKEEESISLPRNKERKDEQRGTGSRIAVARCQIVRVLLAHGCIINRKVDRLAHAVAARRCASRTKVPAREMTVADNCGRVHARLGRSEIRGRKKPEGAGLARGGRRDRAEVAVEEEKLVVTGTTCRNGRDSAYVPYCPRLYTAASA